MARVRPDLMNQLRIVRFSRSGQVQAFSRVAITHLPEEIHRAVVFPEIGMRQPIRHDKGNGGFIYEMRPAVDRRVYLPRRIGRGENPRAFCTFKILPQRHDLPPFLHSLFRHIPYYSRRVSR